jgi:hypothetical protein
LTKQIFDTKLSSINESFSDTASSYRNSTNYGDNDDIMSTRGSTISSSTYRCAGRGQSFASSSLKSSVTATNRSFASKDTEVDSNSFFEARSVGSVETSR